jgi:ATP-dependent DNA helicase RecG
MGTQQSGVLNLKIADIVKDKDILEQARYYAKKVLKEDPKLSHPENKVLLNTYKQLSKYKNMWNYIS